MRKIYTLLLVLLMAVSCAWATNYDVKIELVYYDYPISTRMTSEKLLDYVYLTDVNWSMVNNWYSVPEGTDVTVEYGGSSYFTLESFRYGKSQTKVTGQDKLTVKVTSENVNQQGQMVISLFMKHKYLTPKTDNTDPYCYQAYGTYRGENGYENWGRPVLPMNDWWGNTYMEYPADSTSWYVYYTSTAKTAGEFVGWVPQSQITYYGSVAEAQAGMEAQKEHYKTIYGTSSPKYQVLKKFENPSFKIDFTEWEAFLEICGVTEATTTTGKEYQLIMRPVFKAKPDFEVTAFSLHGEIYCTYGGTLVDSNDSTWYYTVPPTGDKQIQLGIRNIESGWDFDHWTFNGSNVSTSTLKTFNLTGNAWITAEFVQHVETYYTVIVESKHGTVYDRNGLGLITYMGSDCFYTNGTLSLDVKDIDEGWEFDYWRIDDENVGSSLPYSLTPTTDMIVVEAVYKEKETPVTPPDPTADYNETYVCDFTKQVTGHTAYGDSWVYDSDWTIYGGANNNKGWEYAKMGGKSATLANANPVYVVNKSAFEKEIKAVKVYYNSTSLSKGSMGINEWGVKVYSDLDCTTLLYTIAGGDYEGDTDTIAVLAEDSKAWNAGYAIQVYWDLVNGSTTNGVIGIDKISFLTEKGTGTPTGIDAVAEPAVRSRKFVRNGQIFIEREGKIYNAIGAEVK